MWNALHLQFTNVPRPGVVSGVVALEVGNVAMRTGHANRGMTGGIGLQNSEGREGRSLG